MCMHARKYNTCPPLPRTIVPVCKMCRPCLCSHTNRTSSFNPASHPSARKTSPPFPVSPNPSNLPQKPPRNPCCYSPSPRSLGPQSLPRHNLSHHPKWHERKARPGLRGEGGRAEGRGRSSGDDGGREGRRRKRRRRRRMMRRRRRKKKKRRWTCWWQALFSLWG
jgi:hypothetical protein